MANYDWRAARRTPTPREHFPGNGRHDWLVTTEDSSFVIRNSPFQIRFTLGPFGVSCTSSVIRRHCSCSSAFPLRKCCCSDSCFRMKLRTRALSSLITHMMLHRRNSQIKLIPCDGAKKVCRLLRFDKQEDFVGQDKKAVL